MEKGCEGRPSSNCMDDKKWGMREKKLEELEQEAREEYKIF